MTLTTPAPQGLGVDSPPSAGSGRARAGRQHVTAVLVAHDGARWLPRALAAIAAQTRPVEVVMAVDTGSDDGSPDLLRAALGAGRVLDLGRRTGFGAAVRAGLEHAAAGLDAAELDVAGFEVTGPIPAANAWVWLLHDDAAPQPSALAHLLDAAAQSAQVGVVGPKLVEWDDSTRLVEMGLTVSRGGRRSTGLADAELDQGQHDHRADVLAVGTAGMLVSRELWDRLGGLDPALPLMRDDIDLCWRAHLAGRRVVLAPRAVVADAQASSRGLRSVDAVRAPVRRVDRRHALHVALARCSWLALPLVLGWLVLGGLASSIGLLAARAPRRAFDELAATLAVTLTPWTWLGSRWRARGTRSVRRRDVAGLLAPRWGFVRRGVERLGGLAAREGLDARERSAAARAGRVGDHAAPVAESSTRRMLRHPMTSVLLVVAATTAVADRGLVGRGELVGGELLGAGGRPVDLWRSAVDSWSGAGLGGPQASSPAAFVRAAATALLAPVAGEAAPARVVDVLLLGAPLLAALSAYVAAGLLTRARWARGWAALTWASLPLLSGAIGAGRLGPVAAYVLLPPVAAAFARALAPRSSGSWHACCAAALGLTLLASAVPALFVAGMLVALGGVIVGRGSARARALTVLVLVPVLLGPWLMTLLGDPRLLLAGPGALQSGTGSPLHALAALAPMPSGLPPWAPLLLVAPLLVAGVGGLLRGGARGSALLACWVIGLLGLAAAVAAPLVTLTRTPAGPVHPFAGTGVMLVALAAVAGAVAGADGLRARLARHGFGWRQLLVVPVVTAAALAPVAASVASVLRGTDGKLQRTTRALPAVAVDAARGPAALRALTISGVGTAITYRLGGAEPGAWSRDLRTTPAQPAVTAAVRSLTSATPSSNGLRDLAVGFVVVEPTAPAQVAARLDTVAGLAHLGSSGGASLWRVLRPLARVTLDTGGRLDEVPVSGPASAVDIRLAPGTSGRRLVLAEPASPGWRATLDGHPLTWVSDPVTPWRQVFVVPGAGGHLVVRHADPVRRWWLVGQGALAAMLLLAVPGRRRRHAR